MAAVMKTWQRKVYVLLNDEGVPMDYHMRFPRMFVLKSVAAQRRKELGDRRLRIVAATISLSVEE